MEIALLFSYVVYEYKIAAFKVKTVYLFDNEGHKVNGGILNENKNYNGFDSFFTIICN